MKKILSVLLIVAAIAGAVVFPAASENGLSSSKAAVQPNTYIPRSMLWYNSRGAVYVKDIEEENIRGLFYKAKGKDEVCLTGFDKTLSAEFYLRGDTVYYSVDNTLYSVKTDGSSSQKLLSGVKLVGGYGSKVVFYYSGNKSSGYYVLKSSGKVSRLWKYNIENSEADTTLFDGKIYTGSNIFDIAQKKVTSVKSGTAYYDMCYANKNYLYYVNETSQGYIVNRIDANGRVKMIDKYAGYRAVIGMNESRTVIYKDSDGNLYRQTGAKASVLIATQKQVAQLFGVDATEPVSVYNACVRGDKIVFCASYDYDGGDEDVFTKTLICETGKNGGELKVVNNSLENQSNEYRFSYCSVAMYSDSLFLYKYYTKTDEDYKWNSEYLEIV